MSGDRVPCFETPHAMLHKSMTAAVKSYGMGVVKDSLHGKLFVVVDDLDAWDWLQERLVIYEFAPVLSDQYSLVLMSSRDNLNAQDLSTLIQGWAQEVGRS